MKLWYLINERSFNIIISLFPPKQSSYLEGDTFNTVIITLYLIVFYYLNS